MTNNNTPRLLPQIQPGSSANLLTSTPPFRFSHIRDLTHSRTPRNQRSEHRSPRQDRPSTESDHLVASRTKPSQDSSPSVPSVLQSFSASTSSSETKDKKKNKRKAEQGQGEEQGQKERSKRRRGECHYKRTVEKPRGPPSWLIRSNPASVHPPLPPRAISNNDVTRVHPRVPIVSTPTPIIIPITSTVSPYVSPASPSVPPSSHSHGPTSHHDQMDMASLWLDQPVNPVTQSSQTWSFPSSSSSSSSTSLATDPPVCIGASPYVGIRKSSEPFMGWPSNDRYILSSQRGSGSLMSVPVPLPVQSSSQSSITSSNSSSFTSTSRVSDNLAHALFPPELNNVVNIPPYHPAIPFYEARSSYTSNPLMTSGESLGPNTMSSPQRYPGGKHLKYS
ncbi:hypothetical protein I203_101867 [Kwoniella mangroviensis CBS 8507]|uniref:uncharacterized protein n=1 Tax=Kwoniella mangroviensis CBS 8507 TaxID=1296122 RepID=UPI00080D83A3|nr:uncharacterized protein I203_03063 [Kwoniella mangroviensis CBS 8507]OCF67369.1 hypothetical protein I203_03063 [Kwoniella mangroviensis CBS 8507]